MLPLAEAQSRLLAALNPLPTETVDLADADGRILRARITAPLDLPPFDNSAMDGYAVRADDLRAARADHPVSLRVTGELAAGQAPTAEVAPGACMRIFTGSPLPAGADAVIMQEDTRPSPTADGCIDCLDAVKPWENLRFRGQDVRQGTVVAEAGTRLRPGLLGLLAALGCARVSVGSRPRVALLATGNELRPAGEPLAHGQIHESNRAALGALCGRAGGNPRPFPIVPDDPAATRQALTEAFDTSDAVVTIGGASVGNWDFVKSAFAEVGGALDFWRVAMKPGKPFLFGRWRDKPLFGLPGNPVSAFVTFLLLVRPALWRLQGASDCSLPARPGTLAEPLMNPDTRAHFMRVTLDPAGAVRSAGLQASHALRALAEADGLVEVPPHSEWSVGRPVSVLTWD